MAVSLRRGVELRRATPADAPALADLLPERLDARVLALRLARLLADPAATALTAIDYDGAIIGAIAFDWRPTLCDTDVVADITSFVVAEAERRRGIGRMLLKAAAQTARSAGCTSLRLAVPTHAEAARGFGEHTGFGEIGVTLSRSLRKRGLA